MKSIYKKGHLYDYTACMCVLMQVFVHVSGHVSILLKVSVEFICGLFVGDLQRVW